MYLKRLEVQGFKSFATKTLFEFGAGITCIIGPNGSGKSNVAESIRWVLGEQTARNVRARRLEDVIFSGSSQKSAVGMAEVAITLDNAEGWLPVDFSEVVVSRRAYRNGESEYLINKAKVRLRDVLDLFMRAKVGQNSYAFMGQGLVEEVLLMRPEERRRLLEEAADVRLLRVRLDEAKDRLSATRENLERVQLLIDEIGPRLHHLERQAARAADHEHLASELAAALNALYGELWSEARGALAGAEATFDQRQKDLTVVQKEARACEEGLVTLVSAIEERERELSIRRLRHRELNDQVHGLEQRRLFDGERLEGDGIRLREVETELQTLQAERVDLQKALDASRQRAIALPPEVEEARVLIETRRLELSALEQEYAGLRRRIVEAEDRVERGRRGIAEAETGLARIAEDEGRVESDVVRRFNLKQEIVRHLATYGRDFLERGRDLVRVEREMEEAQAERNGLLLMVEAGRSSVFTLESQAMELGGRFAQLQARLDLLTRLQAAQEGVDTGTRLLMGEDSNRGAAEGLLGLVRDIVRVPPGLERAIEASLAENVNALVFENLQTALAAIEMLEHHEAGRALIYPLDAVRPTPPINLLREKGIIGVAARLVRCEAPFRSLVDALLGRTIVVETFGLAQQVIKRGMGAVVTLDGLLLRPSGGVSGGISKIASESFTRHRELDEIPREITLLEARRAEVETRLKRERDSLAGAGTALETVEPRVATLRDEGGRLQAALLECRGRLILLRSEARSLWSELRRGDDIQGDWSQRRDQYAAERVRLAADVKSASEALEKDRAVMSTLATHRNQAIDGVSEAAAAHANLEGEGRSLTRERELLQGSLARVEAQIKGREQTSSNLQREITAVGERMTMQATDLAAAREELDALVAELAPAEGEVGQLVTRERSMREELSGARTRLLAAERGQMEAEAALSIRKEELAALKETMAAEGFIAEGAGVQRSAFDRAGAPAGSTPPPIHGGADVDAATLRDRIVELRKEIRALGPVNEEAATDYSESKERYDFLTGQVDDLQGSEKTLLEAIDELETNIRERLKATFALVDKDFQRYFEAFFAGGKGRLTLTQPDDFANTGLDIVAQPPGKRINTLAQLSGGERALTSVALLLALLEANPSPICVLDEVDAALDEANVSRFVEALRDLAQKTQFIIITHNPRTIEAADVIYGVSMGADSTSKILSLRLSDSSLN